jgi:hypothetical protein
MDLERVISRGFDAVDTGHMKSMVHTMESPQEALARFKAAPAEMPVEEQRALFNWLAEDPERLDVGGYGDPAAAAKQVKRLAEIVGALCPRPDRRHYPRAA